MANIRLGQLLVDARMLSQQALDDVLALQKIDGRRLGTLLVERGLVNETQLTQILSHQLSVPWVALLHIEFSRQLLNLVPYEVAEKYCLVPIYVRHVRGQGDTLYVALDDPSNEEPLRECMKYSGLPVRAMIAPPSDIREAIRVCYGIEIEPPHSKAAHSRRTPDQQPTAQPSPDPPPPVEPQPSSETVAHPPPPPPAEPSPPPAQNTPPPSSRATPPPPPPSAKLEDASERIAEPPATSRSGAPPPPEPPAPPPSQRAPMNSQEPAPSALALTSPPPSDEAPSVPMPSKQALAVHPSPSSQREAAVPASRPRPSPADAETPTVEAVEIDLPPRRRPEHTDADEPGDQPAPSTRRPGRTPRMVALTLLDGTTITLPARSQKPAASPPETLVSPADEPPPPPAAPHAAPHADAGPNDAIAALRAIAAGELHPTNHDGKARWEPLFAATLSLLLKKNILTEAEILEEIRKL